MSINIHGREYVMVHERVAAVHDDHPHEKVSIRTELIPSDTHILFKAIVTTRKGTYTGWSAVDKNTTKQIEKYSSFEVAETSAVGRALGFAGYGAVEGIASAEEIEKATVAQKAGKPKKQEFLKETEPPFPNKDETVVVPEEDGKKPFSI